MSDYSYAVSSDFVMVQEVHGTSLVDAPCMLHVFDEEEEQQQQQRQHYLKFPCPVSTGTPSH